MERSVEAWGRDLARGRPHANFPLSFGDNMALPKCSACGSGMERKTIATSSCPGVLFGILLLIIALIVSIVFFPLGLLIGLPIGLLALFCGGRRSRVWRCCSCRAIIPRA